MRTPDPDPHPEPARPGRRHVTAVYVVVEVETDDGARTRLHEEKHTPNCCMCGLPLESRGVVHGRIIMTSAGRLGFICLRH